MPEDKACLKIMSEKAKLKESINNAISIVRRILPEESSVAELVKKSA
jgi:hypothetical protein